MWKSARNTFVLAFVLTFAVVVPTSAESTPASDRRESLQIQRDQKSTQLREQSKSRRCELTNKTIEGLIARYSANKDTRVNTYKRIVETIQNSLSRLDQRGYSTTTLRAKLAELNNMILEFAATNAELQAQLQAAKVIDCESTNGEFKAAIEEAQTTVKALRAQSEEIHTFIREELRGELKNMKSSRVN